MSYLLLNKPQRLAQFNRTRRHKSTPSGVCVIHTAEGSGANNVANYILTRTSYGSYHRIIDASTTVKLAPWSAETFHCRYTNPHGTLYTDSPVTPATASLTAWRSRPLTSSAT